MISLTPVGGFIPQTLFNPLTPAEGFRAIPVVVPFASAVDEYDIDFRDPVAQGRIAGVQSVFIDNPNFGNDDTYVILAAQLTGLILRCPPATQGWFNLVTPYIPRFTCSCPGANTDVRLIFVNSFLAPSTWQAYPVT